MNNRLNHDIVLLCILFQSCSICSQHNVNKSAVVDSLEETQTDVIREVWSTLPDLGCPVIPDSILNKLLEKYCYTVSYNAKTRQPDWVMWKLTEEHVMPKKNGVWNECREDTDLPPEIRATLKDYTSSRYDRGHMCPGGDCNWDDVGRDETFVLSNMCPQNPKLNRGDWKEIEIACRKWAKQYGNIYIVCGPIFLKSQQYERISPNQILVPEAFINVVLCAESSHPKICRNTDGNKKKDFYVNSIKQVKRVTGYQFFPNLEDSIKSLVYEMDDINEW